MMMLKLEKSLRFGEWIEHFRPSKWAFPEQAAVLTQLQSHYWPPQTLGLHGTVLLPCDNHMWRVDSLRSYWRWTYFLFLLLFSRSLEICRIASKLLQILLLWQQSVSSQAYHSLFISLSLHFVSAFPLTGCRGFVSNFRAEVCLGGTYLDIKVGRAERGKELGWT